MLNLKKFTLGFSCACLLAFSSSLCFASGSPKTVVPATNLPEATINTTINTTIDMSRSIDSQNITAVPATNLSDEIINTKIDMSRSTDSQNITAVPATNLPDEEIDTSVSFY